MLIQDTQASIRRLKRMAKLLRQACWRNLDNKRSQNPLRVVKQDFEFQALPVELAPLPIYHYCAAVSPAAVDWICCPYCAETIAQVQVQPQLKCRNI